MLSFRKIAVVLFAFYSLNLWAQRERNYIYILDCSKSMVSEYHIWDPTLEFLEKDINKLSPNSMVTIVPFQGSVYQNSLVHCAKSDFNWEKYKKQIYDFPTTLTGTNICAAWDQALQYVDSNKDNYLYLLTDGKDNKNPSPDGTENVCRRIRKWCDTVKNSRGYFVMLSQDAADPRIKKAVDECPYMYWTDASKELKPFGSFETERYNYNTLDPEDISMKFSAEGDYRALVKSTNPDFDVTLDGGVVKNGRATLKVSTKGDLSELPEYIEVPFVASSEEIDILNDTLILCIKNLPERSLSLPAEQLDFGEAEYYDSFLWTDAKDPDTLTIDLKAKFNDAALNAGSKVVVELNETTELDDEYVAEPQYTLLYNGEPCTENRIQIKAGEPSVVSIIPSPKSQDGKHYISIKVLPNSVINLENINHNHPLDYDGSLRYDYDVRMNPLKVFLIWLGIIILAGLLLWFLIIRPLLYPTIRVRGIEIECAPTIRTPKIKGCRKVIFTNKTLKQNFLNWLFTGEVKYIKDEFWDSEWFIIPASKKDRVKAMGVSGYSMNLPGRSLVCMEPVKMKSLATGKEIIITIKK